MSPRAIQSTDNFEVVLFPIFNARIVVDSGENHVQWSCDWFSAAVFGQTGAKIQVVGKRNDRTIVLSSMSAKELIATMIFHLRQSRDLSLQDLALKLGLKSHTMLSRYETAAHEPSISQLQRILQALGHDLSLSPCSIDFQNSESSKRVA